MNPHTKTFRRVVFTAIACVLSVTASFSGAFIGEAAAAKKVHRLSLATYDPVTSNQTKIHQEWADRIKKATDGRVEVTVFAGGSLASATEILDAVKTGAADMGWIYSPLYPGQFKIAEAISLPLLGVATAQQAANVLWDLYEENEALKKELSANFKVLFLYTNPSSFIATNTRAVKTVGDLQGIKLRAPAGTATNMLILWGGTPIAMGPGDIYQAVEKGVLDGYILEYTGIQSFKLDEVTKYYTEILFFVGPFMTIMNKNTFDSLPEDLRQIVENESGRETSLQLAKAFQDDWAASRARIIAKGKSTIVNPVGDDLAAFQKAADNYAEEWVKANATPEFDAQAYLNRVRELIVKYKNQ